MATRKFFTPRNTELAQSEVGIFMTKEDPYGVGAISHGKGDLGGKSYGTFQMPSNPSSPEEQSKAQLFVETGIPENYQQHFKDDKGQFYKAGTPGFDAAWKSLERFDNKGFGEAQQSYIYKGDKKNVGLDTYLKGFEKITGQGISQYSDKSRKILEGISNQYGGLGASHYKSAVAERDAAIKNKKPFTENDFMRAVILSKQRNVEKNFKSSPTHWKGVHNRITRELAQFPVTATPAKTPGRKATRTAPAPAPAPAPVRKAKKRIPTFLQAIEDIFTK